MYFERARRNLNTKMRGLPQKEIQMDIKRIKLGDWIESGIHFFSLGYGDIIALWIAKTFFGLNDCHCCSRKEWLNRLTNPSFDGKCNGIKLN